jgi:DNA-binding MarR family transcriptional regulator
MRNAPFRDFSFLNFRTLDDMLFPDMASVRGKPGTQALLSNPGLRDAFVLRIVLATEAIVERAERWTLEKFGLTLRESWILRAAQGGNYSQLALADMLGVNPNVMVLVIDSLEKRGFARRSRNPKNRREQLIKLSDRGRRTLARIKRAAESQYDGIFAPLVKAQVGELTALCNAILEAATQNHQGK